MTGTGIPSIERDERLRQLAEAAGTLGVRVRINRNRRVLLSLRHRRGGSSVLSLHGDLLDHPMAVTAMPEWIRARGHGTPTAIREALAQVWRGLQRMAPPPPPDLTLVGGPVDLEALLDRIHRSWFDHLPRPAIRWARQAPRRRLRHIRFGCYHKGPPAGIQIHPRLDRPWVAQDFLDHVIFHELCHHAQACMPVRGERAHSRRFRMLERSFPRHDAALAWERAHLHRLLAAEDQD